MAADAHGGVVGVAESCLESGRCPGHQGQLAWDQTPLP